MSVKRKQAVEIGSSRIDLDSLIRSGSARLVLFFLRSPFEGFRDLVVAVAILSALDNVFDRQAKLIEAELPFKRMKHHACTFISP